jgi:hypothetical protein
MFDKVRQKGVSLPERLPFGEALESLGIIESRNPKLFRLLRLCNAYQEIEKIDHFTFVTHAKDTEVFLAYWRNEGFHWHGEWRTNAFPARHIALIRGNTPSYPWTDMVGLSISEQANQPLAQALALGDGFNRRETHQLQHIAFNVCPTASMSLLRAKLIGHGIEFLTDVLSYQDKHSAALHQMFTRPNGFFFIEFAQRIPNWEGKPYGGFDPRTIDDLYAALAENGTDPFGNKNWLPTHVEFTMQNS